MPSTPRILEPSSSLADQAARAFAAYQAGDTVRIADVVTLLTPPL